MVFSFKVATKQAQRYKTRKNIENVTESKEKISTLVRIVAGVLVWEPITLTTRLISSIKVNVSQTNRFKLKKML